jgi:hypothetical protein
MKKDIYDIIQATHEFLQGHAVNPAVRDRIIKNTKRGLREISCNDNKPAII